MSLKVKITDGSTTYTLKCERYEHNINRQPTVAPLPGDQTSGATQVLVFDFGMAVENISLTGICDQDQIIEGGDTYPSKANLEEVARKWWKNTSDWVDGTGMTQLTLWTGDAYRGVIKALKFSKEAGKEDRLPFSLQFQVHSKV